MSIFSIFEGLRTYKDRRDGEKGSMRLWVINMWNLLDSKDANNELKLWCKLAITTSSQIYEFLIDNHRDSFKGVRAEDGLKEIVGYLLFNTIVMGGDPFFDKVKFNSISELIMGVGSIFEFKKQTYHRTDSYIMTYKESGKRNISSESQFLLFAIITETNPPMKEITPEMKLGFWQNISSNTASFNEMLKREGLL